MRVGFASGDRLVASDQSVYWGGSGWARLGQYISYFENFGLEIYVGNLVWHKTHFKIDVSNGKMVLKDIDILVMQRYMHEGLDTRIKTARSNGQIVVNDVDDWYWGLSPKNHAHKATHPNYNKKENVNHYKSIIASSDYVIVSTDYLAQRLSQFVRCPIEKLENTVDVSRFHVKQHSDNDVPVVGWVGSSNHRSGDLEELDGILKPMFDAGEIRLQHSGWSPNSRSVASAWGLQDSDLILVPNAKAENYPSIITMDIGLAPLTDIPFNHAKSDIKILEYSASGIPWVASDLTSYRSLKEDWQVGRIAKKPKDWFSHIRELRDFNLRKEEGLRLREKVASRDISIGARKFISFLESIY
jgi:glycosyltransferase involved in cell wall biosynthesis